MAGTGGKCVFNSDCLSGYCFLQKCERPKLYNSCNPGYCPSNAVCDAGTCIPKKTAEDCLSIEYYDNGQCKFLKSNGQSCTQSKQCYEEDICVAGKCRKRCHIDDECSFGEICYSGGCKPGSRPPTTTTGTSPSPTSTPTTPTRQQRPTNNNVSNLSGPWLIASIAVGSLILLVLLILIIWGCYRCCCKSTKAKGQVMSAASPIVVQQAPPAYPSVQSPYMPSSPQPPHVPSFPQSPPQYEIQQPAHYQEK